MARNLRSAAKRKAIEHLRRTSDEPELAQEDHRSDSLEPERVLLPTVFEKHIELKHVFKDVSKWGLNSVQHGGHSEHFGRTCYIGMRRLEEGVAVTACGHTAETEKVETKLKRIEVKTQCYPSPTIVLNSVKDMPHYVEYIVRIPLTEQDDTVFVKFGVNIINTQGLRDNMRHFDERTEDVSDVVLNLNGQKFYTSKLYLATHSTYFKSMFLGNPNTVDQKEFTLYGIDCHDMQCYLELLYGDHVIDETTLEGLILLGKQLQTESVLNKCQKFLMNVSGRDLKGKFELSIKYKLEELMDWCFNKMRNLQDVKKCVPEDPSRLPSEVLLKLLQKSISFA